MSGGNDRLARRLVLGALLAMTGCAAYSPAPLGSAADRVLSGPDQTPIAPGDPVLSIDLSKPLTPRALGIVAVVANPELKAARARAGVTEAQLFDAGLLPDPVLNLSYDKLLSGPDALDGFGAQVVYDLVALRDRGVTLAGRRSARAQARLDLAWREWQVAGQARLLGARIAGLEAAAALQHDARVAAEAVLARVLTAAAHGDLKADDVEVRRLAAADAADKARQGERDLAAARIELNALLGLRPATRIALHPDAPFKGSLDADAMFARARAMRLDLKGLEAGYQSQEAAVRKATWDAFPSLQLTLVGARDTAGNHTLGPAVNFTLPTWNRNAGGIAIGLATREQLRAEFAARVFAARTEIADLVQRVALARRQRADIIAQTRPLDRLAGRAEAAAAAGDVSLAMAEGARRSTTDLRIAIVALDQSIAEQVVALEIAVGGSLSDRAERGDVP